MSTKSREVIWGGRIMGAKMRAEALSRKEGHVGAVALPPNLGIELRRHV